MPTSPREYISFIILTSSWGYCGDIGGLCRMTGDCGERGGYSEGSIDSWGTLRNTNMTPGERRGTVRNAGELWGILWWHREALETDGGLRGTRGYSEGSIGTWGSLKNTSMIVGEGRGTVRKAGELWVIL
ncbi:hypothetical protein QE152_g5305 [Popillia japonica]|uniref:Uncharacterized protein n=1 Tax=Popillia japonica TaxID=7064 RepID=A0AAW1MHY5_POPJA